MSAGRQFPIAAAMPSAMTSGLNPGAFTTHFRGQPIVRIPWRSQIRGASLRLAWARLRRRVPPVWVGEVVEPVPRSAPVREHYEVVTLTSLAAAGFAVDRLARPGTRGVDVAVVAVRVALAMGCAQDATLADKERPLKPKRGEHGDCPVERVLRRRIPIELRAPIPFGGCGLSDVRTIVTKLELARLPRNVEWTGTVPPPQLTVSPGLAFGSVSGSVHVQVRLTVR